MKAAGMTTVVIQHLVWHDAKGDHSLMRPGAKDDAVELILSAADGIQGMTVLLGLWNCDFPTSLFNKAFFDEAGDKTIALVDKAARYIRHRAFGGWYIPLEPWNFKEDANQIEWIGGYLAVATARCKKWAPDKPVAFSCYFNPDPGYASPEETTKVYQQVLADLTIDILMLQDGVGEYGHSDADCRAYFAAFQAACPKLVQFWGDLECFTRPDGSNRIPTKTERLVAQLANAAGTTPTILTFDFFHYMNPNKYSDPKGIEYPSMCAGGPVAPRKALYDAYLHQVGSTPGNSDAENASDG